MTQCRLCGSNAVSPFLVDRDDYEFDVPQKLQYWKCKQASCGLVFVEPLPTPLEIASFYQQYTTHRPNLLVRPFSMISYFFRVSYLKNLKKIFSERKLNEIKVLDFGCGNGNLLKDLRQIGVENLVGYDFDPNACEAAAREGLLAVSSKTEMEQYGSFDYIFLNHVIEHLSDPQNEVIYLASILKKGGKIVLRTPNTKSLLAGLFKDKWRGWETPRHLHVFNNKNICLLFSTMHIERNSTSNFIFSGVFNESFHSDFFRRSLAGKLIRRGLLFIMLPFSLVINSITRNKGEEIYLIAQKQS